MAPVLLRQPLCIEHAPSRRIVLIGRQHETSIACIAETVPGEVKQIGTRAMPFHSRKRRLLVGNQHGTAQSCRDNPALSNGLGERRKGAA